MVSPGEFVQSLLFWEVLSFLALLLLALWAGRIIRRRIRSGSPGGDARRILDERYARGDLSRNEYEQMRRDLEV